MKRILALLLALLLLTGCSTGATEENTITTIAPTEAEAEASTVPETESPTEVPTEEPTEYPAEAETEAPTEAETEAPTEAPTAPPSTEPPATEHKHNYTSSVTAPTCTGKGYTTYTCTCGYSYKGNETPAKGHTYQDTVVAHTCTEKGYTEHKCQTCGHSYEDNETNATGHIISTKVIQQATCTETGLMQNVCENKGCSYTYDIEIEARGHKYETTTVTPTTETEGYDLHTCSVCGHSYKDNYTDKLTAETEPPHEHSYTSEITKAATCTEDGVMTFTCSCGDSYTEVVPKTGHSWSDWVRTKEPTTEAEGQDTRTCATCGATETRAVEKLPEGDDFCEFSPSGEHAWRDWVSVYDENGNRIGSERRCAYANANGEKCDGYEFRAATESEGDPDCTDHEWGNWFSDNDGSYGSCANCGQSITIDESGSNFSKAVVTIINEYRAAEGLDPVAWFEWNHLLVRASELTVCFSHDRPDGGWGAGTCIAAGYGSAQAVVDAWMGSSSHRGSLMNPDATEASAAYNGTFWVLYIG